ncbi:NUC173 domain-domain-containing protein [Yarrowia lipolytica]|uniref:YALI0E07425p n=2 Tax=Yarrowia lipolytica TaxID=4952 RepID=Q6C6P9_YARLI|nr:YALI0E07425p [Yarrowia lipolytica CLIB122]RDW27778.1 NUC173 domain-domain-containing protein [Yarrowia lipolytica]RDW29671.1 NUC173 domain-domain-containing protein [Yarrowia lipolytica]RDW36875.1 NUC173 domain-domain-containing protein [Yarrowia lipolytica]RDW48210.1 NUC173 domain-domain-containing protein [Yarrowia lipolytica]RDW54711.1 NUC173 domain-domain-containing protein [Yarrowia lipolytica]|eukprot:XP_503663.1 YALI0E07425p [Yarrowia lipolytica CLIB122]
MSELDHTEPLEDKLDRIRVHVNSKLANQKQLAIILGAVEENLEEEKTEKTATSYFISFLALLEQSFSRQAPDQLENIDLAASALYFLDLVSPFASESLLRAKFSQIFVKLAPVLGSSDSESALLRSAIGTLQHLLLAQDAASWQTPASELSPRRGVVGLMHLAVNPRPKIRKRALDALAKILETRVSPVLVEHPAAATCADTALKAVKQYLENHKKEDTVDAGFMHALALVKTICGVGMWPMSQFDELCQLLLSISKTTNQMLIQATFGIFEGVFRHFAKSEEDENNKTRKLLVILDAVIDQAPATNDQHLAPAWFAVVAQGVGALGEVNPDKGLAKTPVVFQKVCAYLDSEADSVRTSASQCLVALCSSINQKSLQNGDKWLSKLAEMATMLLSVQTRASLVDSTNVVAALLDTLRWKSDPFLVEAVTIIGGLRTEESFVNGIPALDNALGSAIRAMGPAKVLELLPLNLSNPSSDSPGRAWMLPLLRDNIHNSEIAFFKSEFLPLIEYFDDKISTTKGATAKVFEALLAQVWSVLPRFCALPMDLQQSFDQSFAELLSNKLYSNIEIRPVICQSLRLLVESNVVYAEEPEAAESEDVNDDLLLLERFPRSEAESNVAYLGTVSSKILAVLFNVYGQTIPESRGFILECINAYLGITPAGEIGDIFDNVCGMLHKALEDEAKESKPEKDALPAMSLTMLDILIALVPYIPASSHNTLLTVFVQMIQNSDPNHQKKGYRLLTRLAEADNSFETLEKHLDNICGVVLESAESVTAVSRGARVAALAKLVALLPENDLYFIPATVSEAVIATKDVNEKTRTSAYNLLVLMGEKMARGGVIDNTRIPGLEDAGLGSVNANLTEFFKAVSAGLAGTSPNLVSATITGLSRILFEFKDDVPMDMLSELSQTVELFLTSQNREIVKSTLGFVKITAISLPIDLVEPQLSELLPKLLHWSHEHKGHFKAKVKHIVERLIRRFGFDTIEKHFPEADKKLLTNIRKSKERSKRKRTEEKEEDAPMSSTKPKKEFASEYERALYGDSDSEDEDDYEEEETTKRASKYIMKSDDPLDLLSQQALAHITSSKPRGKKEPLLKSSKFKTNESGKMIFKEDEEEDVIPQGSAIDHYVEAIKNGPVRGQKNKYKYKKSKGGDDDGGDDDDVVPKRPTKKFSRGGVSKPKGKPQQRRKF